ncbi:MAG: T9SS type A sorting domain-containing protein [Flavobacterium sp.]|nr:T9SS type A sorting domain-containing protein [Flavobacterium sp.]
MKKNYFLVFGFLLFFTVKAQIINIPDPLFKARLLSSSTSNTIAKNASGANMKIDANNDNEIQVSEALAVYQLRVNNAYNSNISTYMSSLEGISFFTNLRYLDCEFNSLTSIDLSNLVFLETFSCHRNNLTSIDVSNLVNLKTLMISYNSITELNLNGLVNLINLYVNINQIESLDFTGLVNLSFLDCKSNNLVNLDLSPAVNLSGFDCSYNELTALNIKNGRYLPNDAAFSNNPNLQYICIDEGEEVYISYLVNSYGYTNCSLSPYCSFVPGGNYYTIEGSLKLDLENNGCDENDAFYPTMKCSIYDGINTRAYISSISGNYSFPFMSGSYTITPIFESSSYYIASPSAISANFPAQASPLLQNFCVIPNGNHNDLEVMIVPTLPARPGFDATYKIIYKNKGTTTLSGSVTFQFEDDKMDLVSSTPLFSSQVIGLLTYNYTSLQPFETREINITININSPQETPAVNIGDQLNFTAIINPLSGDEHLPDNTSSLKQIVVGAFDPNDKTCVEGNVVGSEMIGQYVHYVIRFENTGTFPAENIVVKDMIDLTKFNLSTLIPISSSHSFVTRIAADGKVEFIFENIQLPFDDANNDGYVAFKIKTLPSLVVGNTFSNKANIYFDYNFPIETNTATTTIQTLGNNDFDFEEYVTLYPNPTKNELNIKANNSLSITSVNIYNALGQLVLVATNPSERIDVSGLKKGSYFVKVISEKGTSNSKFIKE